VSQVAGIDANGNPSLLGYEAAGTETGAGANLYRIPVTQQTSDLGGGTTITQYPMLVSDVGTGGGGGGNVVQSTRAITDTNQAWYVSQVNAAGVTLSGPVNQGSRDTDVVTNTNMAWYVSQVNAAGVTLTGPVDQGASGTDAWLVAICQRPSPWKHRERWLPTKVRLELTLGR